MSIFKVSNILANRIRTIRNSKGWTQDMLAKKINAHPTYISRIESCQKLPTLNIITSIAEAFGMKVYELFVDPFELQTNNYRKKRIINIVKESGPSRIKVYSTLINALHKDFQKGEK